MARTGYTGVVFPGQDHILREYARLEGHWNPIPANPFRLGADHPHMPMELRRPTPARRVVQYERYPWVEGVPVFPYDYTFADWNGATCPANGAQEKARELFISRLTAAQRETFEAYQCIDVLGSSGDVWRIDTAGSNSFNILNINNLTRHCFHLRDYQLPLFDHFTAQAAILACADHNARKWPWQPDAKIMMGITGKRQLLSLYPVANYPVHKKEPSDLS